MSPASSATSPPASAARSAARCWGWCNWPSMSRRARGRDRSPKSPTPVACGPAVTRRVSCPAGCQVTSMGFPSTTRLTWARAGGARGSAARAATARSCRDAHRGHHVDLLPLPLQGPAVQPGAGRLHALPPDPGEVVRPGRRRQVHPRAGLSERSRLRQLSWRPDPRQRRGAPRAVHGLPQPGE